MRSYPAGVCAREGAIRTGHIKHLPANLEQFPLIHGYGYGSVGDRPTLFAGRHPGADPEFSLNFVSFMQYAG